MPEIRNLSSATVVITGAGSGIGRELAIALSTRGTSLALSDINPDALSATKDLLSTNCQHVHLRELNVADKQPIFEYASILKEEFEQINVVINNAGVGLASGSLDTTSLDDFEWLMKINFYGVLYGCKAFLPLLKQADWGHIVNISSLFGLIGVGGQSAYNSAKFAVRGLTEAMRQELELTNSSVSCTSVHPGGIKTNIARNSKQGSHPIETQDQIFMSDAKDFDKLARTTPEAAAEQIIAAIEKNKMRLLIGGDAKLMDLVQRVFPTHYAKIFWWVKKKLEQ